MTRVTSVFAGLILIAAICCAVERYSVGPPGDLVWPSTGAVDRPSAKMKMRNIQLPRRKSPASSLLPANGREPFRSRAASDAVRQATSAVVSSALWMEGGMRRMATEWPNGLAECCEPLAHSLLNLAGGTAQSRATPLRLSGDSAGSSDQVVLNRLPATADSPPAQSPASAAARPERSEAILQAPHPVSAPFSGSREDEGRDLLLFARGAVQLHPPADWFVGEVPFRREVRLILAPDRLPEGGKMPDDGIWLSYHAALQLASDGQPLTDLALERLRLATASAAVTERIRRVELAGWPAAQVDFSVPSLDHSPSQQAVRRGTHLLALTPWGVCEWHDEFPEGSDDARRSAFGRLLHDVRLPRPQPWNERAQGEVRDAAPILGSWKAYRSRLRLYGDGRIEIVRDTKQAMPIEDAAAPSPVPSLRVGGRYTARGDLIFVVWDDGSRLNLRWRRAGRELLLTDHDGQVSQLTPLLE